MRLSESQAMALLHAMLGGEVPQDRLAIMLGLDRGTVATALEGNDDHYFNTKTRKRTKDALDACIDPQKKQVSEHIASAYDWLDAKNIDYSEELLGAIKSAIGEPIVDKWANISSGQDLKKELQSNLIEMEKICDAVKDCMQIETNKEHKARREREKAAEEATPHETTIGATQESKERVLNANRPEDGRFSDSPSKEYGGAGKRPEPPRARPTDKTDYWRQPIEPDTPIEQPPKKTKWQTIVIAATCLIAAALIAAFAMRLTGSTGAIEIYSSEVMSYTVAGYQQEPSSEGISNAEPLSVNEAFSCLNFVQNTSKAPTMISSTTFVADEVDEIVEPVVKIEPIVTDGKLLVYAANNGWGILANSKIDLFVSTTSDSKRLPLAECFAEEASMTSDSLAPGAILLLGKYNLDYERYTAITNPNSSDADDRRLRIYATIPGEDESFIGYLAYDPDSGFVVEYGGQGGGPRYSTSLFAVLNVDDGPGRISFTSEGAAPRVEDVFRIETVIAPTRSCSVRFHEEFAVGDSIFSTDEHEVTVRVPYYEADSFANNLTGGSPLAQELSHATSASAVELEHIAEKYKHNPENLGKRILANQATHGSDDGLDVDYILQELAK